jgi:hypothetical protein
LKVINIDSNTSIVIYNKFPNIIENSNVDKKNIHKSNVAIASAITAIG